MKFARQKGLTVDISTSSTAIHFVRVFFKREGENDMSTINERIDLSARLEQLERENRKLNREAGHEGNSKSCPSAADVASQKFS